MYTTVFTDKHKHKHNINIDTEQQTWKKLNNSIFSILSQFRIFYTMFNDTSSLPGLPNFSFVISLYFSIILCIVASSFHFHKMEYSEIRPGKNAPHYRPSSFMTTTYVERTTWNSRHEKAHKKRHVSIFSKRGIFSRTRLWTQKENQ